MEHYILCVNMFMCIVLRGSHQFQFELSLWVARLVTTRGLGAYCPQYVLTIFLFVGFRSVKYVLQLCRPWAKVAYLHFISNLCALHIYECHKLYQILIILSTSKSIFLLSTSYSVLLLIPVQQVQYILSVSIFLDSTSVFLSSLLFAEICSSPCTLHHSRC